MSTGRSQPPRPYHSELRQKRAAENRQRILQAAGRLFEERGFDHVTVDEIAEASGVSTPTVYALFQNKLRLLRTVLDEALSPEQFENLVAQHKAEPDPRKRLAISAQIARRIYDAERSQIGTLGQAAVLSAGIRAVEEEREQRRYSRQEETISRLHSENLLKIGLDVQKARDILWAYTGRSLYQMLVQQRGWTSDEYERWLTDQLCQSLLKVDDLKSAESPARPGF